MITKQITLLAGARNITIATATEHETVLHYNCPTWAKKTCIHTVPGLWKIQSTNLNKVTLVSNDTIIKEKP